MLAVILGVLSDTHGQQERTAIAVRLLRRVGAEAFVHCGDVGGDGVLAELAGLRLWIVCGNTDCPDAALEDYASALGLTMSQAGPLRIELDGRSLAVFHGHEAEFRRLMNTLLETGAPPADFGNCDYVLHGHTHLLALARVGTVRVLNPGALHRAMTHTVATLDLRTDAVEFWEVRDEHPDGEPIPYRTRRR